MATVTPNFNWPVPTSSDLVKDGATAIEALGDSIDASLVDLKGGTTGQILSKTSATDMDFTWVNNDQGDITEVIAGSGISVTSSTGPTPTVALDLTAANVYTAAQTATRYIVTGSTIPTNGMYLPTANNLGFSTNSTARLTIGTTTLSSTLSTTYLAQNLASGSAVLELGTGRAADGSTYIDMMGDTTYTDYGLRIIRNSGANGGAQIISRGTGALTFSTQDVASILFQTQLTTRMTINDTGELGIGAAPLNWVKIITGGSVASSSSESRGFQLAVTYPSTATAAMRNFYSLPATAAATYTAASLRHFEAGNATIGAGSTLTEQVGFRTGGMTGATNNHGFQGNVVAATGAFNFYAQGTAPNYFLGRTGVGLLLTSSAQFGVTNQQSTGDVTVLTRNYAAQTADSISVQNSASSLVWGVTAAGFMKYISSNTATTVGAAGGASALPATPTGYLKIDIGGTEYKVPYYAA